MTKSSTSEENQRILEEWRITPSVDPNKRLDSIGDPDLLLLISLARKKERERMAIILERFNKELIAASSGRFSAGIAIAEIEREG